MAGTCGRLPPAHRVNALGPFGGLSLHYLLNKTHEVTCPILRVLFILDALIA